VLRSTQWLVCAVILVAGGVALAVFGLRVGAGPWGGVLLFATAVGAVLVARRFRKLERTKSLSELDRQMDRFW
jgi:Flp pilus assembly protein TadB